MCSCPSSLRYRQTPLQEQIDEAYLTPDDMLYDTSIRHAKACLIILLLKFGEFQ
jgi:hypothetical protein